MNDSVPGNSTYLFKLWSFIAGSVLIFFLALFLLKQFMGTEKATKLSLQADLQSASTAIKTKNEEIDRLSQDKQQLQNDLEKTRTALTAKLRDAKATLETELNAAKNKLTARDASIAGFMNDIKKLNADLENTRRESQAAVNEANEKLQTALKNIKEKEEASDSERSQKIEAATQLLTQREQTINSLKGQVRELTTNQTSLQDTADALKGQLKRVTAELDRKTAEIVAHKKQIKQLQEKLKETGEELDANLEINRQALDALGEREKIIAEMNVTLNGLKNELKTQVEQINGLNEQLHNSDTLITQKDNQLIALREKIAQSPGEQQNADKQSESTNIAIQELKNRLAEDLSKQFDPSEVFVKDHIDGLVIGFSSKALFGSGSTRIAGAGQETLKNVAQLLQAQGLLKNYRIRVVGHTDTIPVSEKLQKRYPSNWELSTARAAAVVRYLIRDAEVDPAALEAVGASSFQPVSTNDTPEGQAKNRRIEMVLMPLDR